MSKVKRIIEIEESDLERIREIVERENKTALSVTTRGTAYITIADSKLYEDSGDCISREALKKDLESIPVGNHNAYWISGIITAIERVEKIDSVPEVFTLEDMQNNYDAGVDSVIGKYDKAKGEWIAHKNEAYECPFCHKQITGTDLNFCVKCGADMRGGAE